VSLAYLTAGLLFILSLGGLSAQASARRGNQYGIAGMVLALVATAFNPQVGAYWLLAGAMVPAVAIGTVLAGAALVGLGLVAPPAFLSHLTVFALACVVGWQVVWNVTPALHTPLMSVTNAISGIIVVGGMLTVSGPAAAPAVILGAAAILLASINIAGGFLVTQRMLRMFRR
jgi:hypothetical protein